MEVVVGLVVGGWVAEVVVVVVVGVVDKKWWTWKRRGRW